MSDLRGHSATHPAICGHNLGDNYPLTIIGQGYPLTQYRVFHCLTGWEGELRNSYREAEIDLEAIRVRPEQELGMQHPLIMARFQARVDAGIMRQNFVSYEEALAGIVPRIRKLFGPTPEGMVEAIVAKAYEGYRS